MSTREAFLPLTARSRASVPADAATRSQDGISPFSVSSNVRSGRQSRTNATAGHEACKPAATAMTATSGTPSKMVNLIPARLCLVTVAFLYGTLNVCLRLIYARPDPPMASVISVIRGAIMILFFLPSLVRSLFLVGGDSSLAAAPRRRRQLCWTALELGFLNVAATGLLAVGVALTSSSVRASFLAQTSVVITPVLSVLAGERVKGSMWGGALLALVGVFVLATAGATVQDNGSVSSIDSGDMVMLACALSWSAYLFRFGRVADRFERLELQAAMAMTRAILYSVWFSTSAAFQYIRGGWEAVQGMWLGNTDKVAWALLLFSAVGSGGVAGFLQQRGQAVLTASESNIILSSEPLFTGLCGWAMMGERMKPIENVGGMLIVGAAVVASGAFDGLIKSSRGRAKHNSDS